MSAQSNERNPLVLSHKVGAVSADEQKIAVCVPYKCKLLSAKLVNGAAIAADNTDYVICQVKVGSTVLASVDTRAAGQGAVTSKVAKELALTADEQSLVAGSVVELSVNVEGAAVLTDALLVLHVVQKESA